MIKQLALVLFLLVDLWPPSIAQSVPARMVRKYTLPAVKPGMPDNDIVALALSPDGKTVAYVSGQMFSGDLFLWDLCTGRQRFVEQEVGDVAFSPNGRLIAYDHIYFTRPHSTGDMLDVLSLYDLKARKRLCSTVVPDGYEGFTGGLAFSPNGKAVACGVDPLLGGPTEVRVYRIPALTLQSKLVANISRPVNIAFSDDGCYVGAYAYAGPHSLGSTAVWSVVDRRLLHTFYSNGEVIFAPHQHTLLFKFPVPDKSKLSHALWPLTRVGENRFLFCRLNKQGYDRGQLELWSLTPRKKLRQWTGTELVDYMGEPVALSSDGKTLVGVCNNTQRWSVLVWRLD